MKYVLILLIATVLLGSCSSSFSPYSKYNQITDSYYLIIYNEKLNIKSFSFGDFKFAHNDKEFKKLKGEKSSFKNVLLYGLTNPPEYEYYILQDSIDYDTASFNSKHIKIDNRKFQMLISKSAPIYDKDFLMDSIQPLNSK